MRNVTESPEKRRTRTVRPYPQHTLQEVLAIPQSIMDLNAGLPFDRIHLAGALDTTPGSSAFMMKLNSSAKYGLTRGGYNDARIELTDLGRRATAAEAKSDERRRALLDAALTPDIFRRFFEMLEGKRLPDDSNAHRMLETQLGVPSSLTQECLRIIKANGELVGALAEVNDSLYVTLSSRRTGPAPASAATGPVRPPAVAAPERSPTDGRSGKPLPAFESEAPDRQPSRASEETEHAHGHEAELVRQSNVSTTPLGKIFVGHSGAVRVAEYVKAVFDAFGAPHAVVESDPDDSRPLSPDVSAEMRRCSAAVLIVVAQPEDPVGLFPQEPKGIDKMSYQLGAASMLYGPRIVLLREEGADGPPPDAGVSVLPFRRDRIRDIGLALLSELRRLGVIELRVNPTADR